MADKSKKLIYQLEAQNAKYLKKIEQSQRRLERFAKQTSKSTQLMRKRFQSLDRAAAKLGGALAAVFGARALASNINNTVKLARQVSTLSALANTASTDFQKLAYAAEQYGISQEKVADILKDTSDKVGDFLQTGGGPLADFFEKIGPRVGVTAAQFRHLSGDQALGLYVKSLEQANLSQNEMTFFMEAIASDSTLLLPLFRNNARELKNMGDQAEKLGAVFSAGELAQLEQVNVGYDRLRGVFAALSKEVALGALPSIEKFVKLLSDPSTIEAARSLASATVKAFTRMNEVISNTVNTMKFLAEEAAAGPGGANADMADRVRSEERIQLLMQRRETILKRIERAENQLLAYQRGPAVERFKQQLDVIDTEIAKRRAMLDELAGAGGAPSTTAPSTTAPSASAALEEIDVNAERKAHFYSSEDVQAARRVTEAALTPLEQLIVKHGELQHLLDRGLITQETFDRTIAGLSTTSKKVDDLGNGVSEFAQQAKRNLQDGLVDVMVSGFEDGTRSMLDSFTDFLKRATAELAASKILELLGGSLTASGGGALGNFFAGFFAQGGRIPAGQFGVVGEQGPELVSGPAMVHAGIGAGDNVTVNIDARNADPLAAAQMAQMGRRLKDDILSTLYDRKARGRF